MNSKNSQLQSAEDVKLILSTDKRFWAAGGFIAVALFVWLATTTWRTEPAPPPERYKLVKVEEQEKVNILIKDFLLVSLFFQQALKTPF